jgi:hypothetical protein
VSARVTPGDTLETVGGIETMFQDPRVVDFSRVSAGLSVRAITTSYAPMVDVSVLGEFVRTFGRGHVPTEEEIVGFYGRYGNLGDEGWVQRLPDYERERLPRETRLGLREPLWYSRELGTEIEFHCELYRGLREEDADLLREEIGPVPAMGRLVDMDLLAGRLVKRWESPEDSRRGVGPFGEWFPSEGDPGRPMTDEEGTQWARVLLLAQLNRYEERAHREWTAPAELSVSGERGRPPHIAQSNLLLSAVRTLRFDSLITALYLQLSDAVASQALLRRCRHCDRLFFPPRGNAYYCAPQCSNAQRQRRFQEQHAPAAPENGNAR